MGLTPDDSKELWPMDMGRINRINLTLWVEAAFLPKGPDPGDDHCVMNCSVDQQNPDLVAASAN